MYAGVPRAIPTDVRLSAPVAVASAFDTPKSVTSAWCPDSNTLSGLMSRCTIWFACACDSASTTSRRMRSASWIGSSCCRASLARSDSPEMYGMA